MAGFTDDFNRANGNLSAGANWDGQHPGGSAAGLVISSNTVYLRGGASYSGSCLVAAGAYAFSDKHTAQVTLTTAGTDQWGILVRATFPSGTKLSGYGLRVAATGIYLYEFSGWAYSYLAGAPTRNAIGSWVSAISITDVIKLEAQGTTIKAYVNSVERISVTDAVHASGRPGIYVNSAAGTFNYVDDFEALELTPVAGGGSPFTLGGLDGSWNRNMSHP